MSVEAAERALSRQLARLVRYRFDSLNTGAEEASDAVAESEHIARDFDQAARLLSKLQMAYEQDASSAPDDLKDSRRREFQDAVMSHRQRLAALRRSFSAFLHRMAAPAPTVVEGASGGGDVRRPDGPREERPVATAPRLRPSASGAASGATAEAALRRTRAAMARELSRLSSVSETVDRDSTMIEASRSRHLVYAGAVQDTYNHLWAQQRKAWRSSWPIILAAGVFFAVVTYIVASRGLWLWGIAI